MFSQLSWCRSTCDSSRLRIGLVLLLLIFSFLPRFYNLTIEEPQPDELHWRMRSADLATRFKNRDFSHLTTYLGHPGIPPALIMAGSQMLLSRSNDSSIDTLAASRIGCATASALIPVVLFLGFAPLVGTLAAFIAALFVALDPYHIGVSRMAHLDGTLSLLVLITVLSYYKAATTKRWNWYVVTGVAWGLCVLTKPTAVLMIPAIVIWKVIERASGNRQIRIVDPLDLVVVVTGHLVMAALFTRLWIHNSEYLRRLKVYTPVADAVYQTGLAIQRYPAAAVAALLLLGAGGWAYFFWRKSPRLSVTMRSDLIVLWLTAFIGLAALTAVPQILENLVRFWWWVGGLSGHYHRAYGEVHLPPAGGYPILLLSRLPVISIISGAVGVVWCLLELKGRSRSGQHGFSRSSIALLVVLILIVWGSFLSISSKQALRYLLPSIVAAMIVAGIGWTEIFAWIFDKQTSRIGKIKTKLAWPLAFLLCAGLFEAVADAYPRYFLYFNSLSGGLPSGVRRLTSLPVIGQMETISYLDAKAAEARRGLTVAVYGDLELLTFVHDRFFRGRQHPLRFIFSARLADSDYLAVFPFARKAVLGPVRKNLIPVYTYAVDGVVFVRLYKIKPFDFSKPYTIRSEHGGRTTGGLTTTQSKSEHPGVYVLPGEHKKGFLMADSVLAEAGRYRIEFDLKPVGGAVIDPALSSERYVARLDFGKECSRIVTLGELRSGPESRFSVLCDVPEAGRKNVRVYWFGTVPVEQHNVSIAAEPVPGQR